MKFKQHMGKDEESVDLQLQSRCDFDVLCTLEWDLRCTGDDSPPSSTPEKHSTTVDSSDTWQVNASAGTCEESWEIANVRWNCVPVLQ